MGVLKNAGTDCGNKKPPGVLIDIYYTSTTELNGFPGLLQTTDEGDSVTLDGPFDFTGAAAGSGYWRKVVGLTDRGGLKMLLEGDPAGQGLTSSLRFFYSGSEAGQVEFLNDLRQFGGCLSFMAKQRDSDRMRVIGTTTIPAVVESAELDGGEGNGDPNGTPIVIRAQHPLYFYDDATHGVDTTPNP